MATKITLFITSAGFDVLTQVGDAPQAKARIGYDTMRGVVGGLPIELAISNANDDIIAKLDGVEAVLKPQLKGHYFGFVGPKPVAIGLAEARKLIAAAQAQRDGRPSRKGRRALEPDASNMPNDQIPF